VLERLRVYVRVCVCVCVCEANLYKWEVGFHCGWGGPYTCERYIISVCCILIRLLLSISFMLIMNLLVLLL